MNNFLQINTRIAQGKFTVEEVERLFNDYKALREMRPVTDSEAERELRNAALALRQDTENVRSKALRAEIAQYLSAQVREEKHANVRITFDDLFGGYTERQLELIIPQIAAIELTKGCSVGCPNCNFNALKRTSITMKLSGECLNELIDRYGHALSGDLMLYYATDPLDWEDGATKYIHLLESLAAKNIYPQTTTAIPAGKEDAVIELWRSKFDVRLSISNVNYRRLVKAGVISGETYSEIEESLGPPGNYDSHVIGSSKKRGINFKMEVEVDRDLGYRTGDGFDFRSLQPSIGCKSGVLASPSGLHTIYSTQTTPLSPNGFIRTQLLPDSQEVLLSRYDNSDHRPFSNKEAIDLQTGRIINLPLTEHQALETLYRLILDSRQVRRIGKVDLESGVLVLEGALKRSMLTSEDSRSDVLVYTFACNTVASSLLQNEQQVFEGNAKEGIPNSVELEGYFKEVLRQLYKDELSDYLYSSYSEGVGDSALWLVDARVRRIVESHEIWQSTAPTRFEFPLPTWDGSPFRAEAQKLADVYKVMEKAARVARNLFVQGVSEGDAEARKSGVEVARRLEESYSKVGGVCESVLKDRIEFLGKPGSSLKGRYRSFVGQQFRVNMKAIAEHYRDSPGLSYALDTILKSDLAEVRTPSIELLALHNLNRLRGPLSDLYIEALGEQLEIFANALILSPKSEFIERVLNGGASLEAADFIEERDRLLGVVAKEKF